jgi:hypothetical protein
MKKEGFLKNLKIMFLICTGHEQKKLSSERTLTFVKLNCNFKNIRFLLKQNLKLFIRRPIGEGEKQRSRRATAQQSTYAQ